MSRVDVGGVRRLVLATLALVIVLAGAAWADFQALPPGDKVNDDPAKGIDPARSVSGTAPTNSDVAGGALTAGRPGAPWAIFRQATQTADEVFVRSFAGGAWTTRGDGTAGGASSAAPTFPGSLNFDQTQDGEAPSIDFAGAGRTVPWATWYENTTGGTFSNNNIFASRFDNTGDATQGKWLFAGQSRGMNSNSANVPSLNIHTNQDAENPSVAGGSTADPTKPGPWVTWQETGANAPGTGKDQIFAVKPIGPGATNCVGVSPGAADPTATPIGGFCWQQVGVERLGTDPSLNVDRTRDGVQPDIAFTGANDSVPWVVWYETGPSGSGLNGNDMVFAAKGVPPGTPGPTGAVDGGLNWIAVGNGAADGSNAQGVLDDSAGGGPCAGSQTAEAQCSLNSDPSAAAEDPQVAAGTMTPGAPTAPWVAWTEFVSGKHQIFVSRLVGGPTGHFAIANGKAAISPAGVDATRPDITFSGHTPYVSWRQTDAAGSTQAAYGHFFDPSNPTFVMDNVPVGITPTATADVREPTSSACTATPFNGDGSACQGGAVGTPFFLFTSGTSPLSLFAQAYQTDVPATGGASGVGADSATVSATVDPQGAPVSVAFQYGTTTAYGQTTPTQTLAPATSAVPFSAGLGGLPSGTTIHYRAIATTDFGTVAGNDATFSIAVPPPPKTTPPIVVAFPALAGLSESHVRWAEGNTRATLSRKRKPRRTPVGTTFTFSVNTAGRVQLVFDHRVRGRRVKGRCVAQTKRSRRKRACARTVTAGSFGLPDHTGVNHVHFAGLLPNGHKLRPGTYTLVLTATNSVGQKSAPRRLSFTIVKR